MQKFKTKKPWWPKDVAFCQNYVLWLLARTDYSVMAMRQKLQRKVDQQRDEVQRQADFEVIEQCLSRMVELGMLNDLRKAQSMTLTWSKKEAPSKVAMRLKKALIDPQIIEQVMQEVKDVQDLAKDTQEPSDSLAYKLISKKFANKKLEYNKITRFLVSKGVGFSESKKAISDYLIDTGRQLEVEEKKIKDQKLAKSSSFSKTSKSTWGNKSSFN